VTGDGTAVPATGPATTPSPASTAPGPLVLVALILVATVANLNLSVANVALPDIGEAFDASQTGLNLVAVGYSLGLAASVLWLGALGDRYGRKMMLVLGTSLAIPASLAAAYAPSLPILAAARLFGGLAAGMAFPTTLALIAALWSGPGRTRSIALWSGIGGAMAALGPLAAGAMLEHFWWGSVFLITLPLAVVAVVGAIWLVPSGVNETTASVDNLGGILSVVMVGSVVLGINIAPEPGMLTDALVMIAVGLVAVALFVVRQRRAREPLYDLDIAGRRTFWVAGVAGIIVFGALMGAMFIGQQFLQEVLGYDTFDAGLSMLPAAIALVLVAPYSAKLVEGRGSRFTLLIGYLFCVLGFVAALVLWQEGASFLQVGVTFVLVGIGVGLAGTPASRSLTGSVPVRRAGMASGTADLQRDLGGAIMQSILGALLTAGYATRFAKQIAASPQAAQVSDQVESQLQKSFTSAEQVAARYPQYADQITAAAKESFVAGQRWALTVGLVAMLGGVALVWLMFPRHDDELAMLRGFVAEDAETDGGPGPGPEAAPTA
jgi:DHA2 family multidrug resistance protein-like MFS transporter